MVTDTSDFLNNHTSQAEQRVRFGPGETDTMPLDWAENALTWLRSERPQVFADMMTVGVFGIEKRAGRR